MHYRQKYVYAQSNKVSSIFYNSTALVHINKLPVRTVFRIETGIFNTDPGFPSLLFRVSTENNEINIIQ